MSLAEGQNCVEVFVCFYNITDVKETTRNKSILKTFILELLTFFSYPSLKVIPKRATTIPAVKVEVNRFYSYLLFIIEFQGDFQVIDVFRNIRTAVQNLSPK